MAFIGNLLWFVFGGGFIACLLWLLFGGIMAITVVGIPFAHAAFRIARFAALPFGRELIDARLVGETRIAGTALANLLWVLLAGIWLSLSHLFAGIAYLITIIGIPFALAHFKLAGVCFAPLGKRAVNKEMAIEARKRAASRQLDKKFANQNRVPPAVPTTPTLD
jgi:uncharacterized membrane protein YccF (DUF307 family)